MTWLYQVWKECSEDDDSGASSNLIRQGVHYEVIGGKNGDSAWVVCRIPKCQSRVFQSLDRYQVHAHNKHGLGTNSVDSDSDHRVDVPPPRRNVSRRKPPGNIDNCRSLSPCFFHSRLIQFTVC